MVSLGALWLPMVLAAVGVWIVSALFWTVSPHHKADYKKVGDEDGLLDALRRQPPAPGQYMFPFAATPKEAEDPAVSERFERGPVGVLTVWPNGKPNMGKAMVLSVVFYLVVSFVVAYVGSRTVAPGAPYLAVFRVTGTAAFLAYSFGGIPNAIWFGTPWKTTWKVIGDGLVYGLVTAGFFGWLWP